VPIRLAASSAPLSRAAKFSERIMNLAARIYNKKLNAMQSRNVGTVIGKKNATGDKK
jgi:hypothetical protein